MHRPEDAGLADEGRQGVALAKPDPLRRVDEAAQRREGDHQITHHADGGTEPVSPGGEEPHQLAKAGPGIAVDAAVELGFEPRQVKEAHGQRQYADPGDGPADQHGASARHIGHVLGQAEDAGPTMELNTSAVRDQSPILLSFMGAP